MSNVQKAIQKLERTNAIAGNICSQGHHWCIFSVRGTSLFEIAPGKATVNEKEETVMLPDRNIRLPESLVSKYTNSWRAQKEIEKYLRKSWDMAEEAELRNQKKNAATDEARDVAPEFANAQPVE